MFDELSITARICAAIGATVALFATFLPWYSYEVVLPAAGAVHVFSLTATLWAFTTLAPILLVVGAGLTLILVAVAPERVFGPAAVLFGIGILAYAIVRCFDIPHLGVLLVGPNGAARLATITQLEGGTFVAIGGGAMMLLGGLAALSATKRADVPVEERARATGVPGAPGTTGTPGAAHPAS
jgi:hypothetical protein